MKSTGIVALFLTVLSLCSCARPDLTLVEGRVSDEFREHLTFVEVTIPGVFSEMIRVEDGRFRLELPVCTTELCVINAARFSAFFISDGTELDVLVDEESKVTSRQPDESVQERFNRFQEDMLRLQAAQEDVNASKEALDAEFIRISRQYVLENGDNIIGLCAFTGLCGEIPSDQLRELAEGFSEELKKSKIVTDVISHTNY